MSSWRKYLLNFLNDLVSKPITFLLQGENKNKGEKELVEIRYYTFIFSFFFLFEKHYRRPNQTSYGHPRVKLIDKRPIGISLKRCWVWIQDFFWSPIFLEWVIQVNYNYLGVYLHLFKGGISICLFNWEIVNPICIQTRVIILM